VDGTLAGNTEAPITSGMVNLDADGGPDNRQVTIKESI
jgi:hypothetical protein